MREFARFLPISLFFTGSYSIRDGFMVVDGNHGSSPNYEPNSVSGTPTQGPEFAQSAIYASGLSGRYEVPLTDDDFVQPGNLYRHVMSEAERQHLISNIYDHLKNARVEIQERMVKIFARCDIDYGRRIARKLGLSELSTASKL